MGRHLPSPIEHRLETLEITPKSNSPRSERHYKDSDSNLAEPSYCKKALKMNKQRENVEETKEIEQAHQEKHPVKHQQ
jgi:hypothetical protein